MTNNYIVKLYMVYIIFCVLHFNLRIYNLKNRLYSQRQFYKFVFFRPTNIQIYKLSMFTLLNIQNKDLYNFYKI